MILSTPSTTRSLRPTNYAHAFEKMKQQPKLSIAEQALHTALLKVKTPSFWGDAIKDVFQDYTVLKFRELICELLSQNDDAPDSMKRILGEEAYELLLKQRP